MKGRKITVEGRTAEGIRITTLHLDCPDWNCGDTRRVLLADGKPMADQGQVMMDGNRWLMCSGCGRYQWVLPK